MNKAKIAVSRLILSQKKREKRWELICYVRYFNVGKRRAGAAVTVNAYDADDVIEYPASAGRCRGLLIAIAVVGMYRPSTN